MNRSALDRCPGNREDFSVPENPPLLAPPGIALFDLDGTLLAWDCQLLFRHQVVRREPWRGIFLPVYLTFLPLIGLLGIAGLKRIFLSYLWRMDAQTLAEHAKDFADSVMPTIYPEIRQKLEAHRRAGDFLILASASPEFYVAEIGKNLGFDLTLGTVVETDGHLAFFPDLENHKGQAKVDRLRSSLPSSYFEKGKLVRATGYTDSTADLPMLAICDTAVVVNPSQRLTDLAEKSGWEIFRPQRPWKSQLGFFVRVFALLTGLGKDPGGLRNSER